MLTAATALPPLATFAICLALISANGGIEPTTWLPAALLQLALFVVVASAGSGITAPRGTLVAIGVLGALTLWSYGSIAWADVRAPAWDGANLTAFYLLAFAALALWPIRPSAAAAVLTAFAGGLVVLGAIVLREGAVAADPAAAVIYARRLSEPLGYPNATAVVFGMGAWLMLALSTQSWLGRWWRALAVGFAVVLAQVDFLAQSRGAVYTTPIVLVVYFALARHRYRAAVPIAILALVSAPAVPTLLDVYNSDGSAEQRDAITAAGGAIAVCALLAALAAALVLPWLDGIPEPGASARRRLRVALLGAAATLVVLVLALASPAARVDRSWEQFKSGGDPVGGSRFSALGSGRYDMWRVGLRQFERHPVQGIGVDNFAVPYLQERTRREQPAYPHSLVVKMLSQLGIVGSLLLAAFVVLAFRWSLGPDTPARGVAAAATVPFAAWFLHATVDWLWEIPACGLTAFALLGVAAGLRNDRRGRVVLRRPRLHRVSLVTAVVGVVIVASSLALPWLAARYEVRAADTWLSEPAVAHAELERAAALNPVSDRPYVLSGAMASRRGDYALMRSSFERALERNPLNWYSHLELALALSQTGETKAAARHAEQAVDLNPRERIVRLVQSSLAAGRSIDPALIDALLLRQLEDL
jgi:hypothetical protein